MHFLILIKQKMFPADITLYLLIVIYLLEKYLIQVLIFGSSKYSILHLMHYIMQEVVQRMFIFLNSRVPSQTFQKVRFRLIIFFIYLFFRLVNSFQFFPL